MSASGYEGQRPDGENLQLNKIKKQNLTISSLDLILGASYCKHNETIITRHR